MEIFLQAVVEDVFADVGIKGAQTVIDQVDICICVESSGDGYSLFLTSGEIYSFFSDFCEIAASEDF